MDARFLHVFFHFFEKIEQMTETMDFDEPERYLYQ